VETAVFLDLADARARIGHFIDWYNFQRVHRGVGGLVPADRFFGAASEVKKTLQARVVTVSIKEGASCSSRVRQHVNCKAVGGSAAKWPIDGC